MTGTPGPVPVRRTRLGPIRGLPRTDRPSKAANTRHQVLAWLLATGCGLYYLVYNERLVSSSGLYFDELIQVAPVINFLHPGRQSPFGHPPHMTMPYIGEVKQLVMLPSFAIFGHGPSVIRTTTIALGLIALALTFLVVRRLTPTSLVIPAVTVLLLSVDPSFLFFSRIDYGPTALQFVLKLSGLLLLLIWWRSCRRWLLFASGFILGVGMYDKADFVWVIGATFGAAAATDLQGIIARLRLRSALALLGGLTLGALPLLRYNLIGLNFPTLTTAQNQPDIARGAVGRLSERLRMLDSVLNGRWIQGVAGAHIGGTVLWRLAGLVVILAIYIGIRTSDPSVRSLLRPLTFSVIALLITIIEAAATTGGFAQHHLVLTYPFPQLAVAISVTLLCRSVRTSDAGPLGGLGLVAAIALVSLITAADLDTNQTLATALERTGGVGNWSNATEKLGPFLKRLRPTSPVLTGDWGISVPLYVYENGDVPVIDVYPLLLTTNQQNIALPSSIFRPGTIVVTHSPDRSNFPVARSALLARTGLINLNPHLEGVIPDGTGHPELEIWRLEGRTNPLGP